MFDRKKDDSLEIFASAPIPKAVLTNAIPAMIAMLMVLIYNMADTFFVGQTHDALMVASVSLATPVLRLIGASTDSVCSTCWPTRCRPWEKQRVR